MEGGNQHEFYEADTGFDLHSQIQDKAVKQ